MNNNKQLSDFDIGVILIIKKHHANLNKIREEVAEFSHDYYLIDKEYFGLKEVSDKIIEAFIDFISCSDHVYSSLKLFFEWKERDKTDVEAAMNVLMFCAVTYFNHFSNTREYVNGFHDFKYGDLELTLDS